MTSLMPKLAVLLLSIVLLLPERSSAGYVLEVRTYTYRNRDHRQSNGECCDPIFWSCKDCDNIFIFCLRDANNRDDNADNCPLGRSSFKDYRDTINFPQNDSSIHCFTSQEPWPGSVLLYVRIIDYDWYNRNDHVDNIYIPIRLNPGQSIAQRTFEGDYRRSRFELSIQLHCQPNFYGGECLTNCVPTDDNTGHFRCSPQGERLCLDKWRDPANHCLTPMCEECNPIGGRCTAPDQCTCLSGWTGTQCNYCSRTSPGCSTEGGYCKRPGECQCHKGYGGDNCEVYLFPCEREPCQNGATCINDHGHGGYSCQCSSGYGGRNCTLPCEEADVDCTVPCNNLTNPCENGGTCQTQTSGEGISNCTCSKGFSGEYCEISVDDCMPNPCRNGGTCQHSTSTYVCICAEGYTGAHCEEDIDYCFTQPCQNNGTCVDLQGSNYTCSCPNGWAGRDCSEERDECREFQPCKNGANCTDLFNDYKCRCAPGYVGRDCEQEIKKCSSNPCKNGNCTDLFNGYTCQCFDEFTGVNCETDLNSCCSAPCRNGGTCENKPDGFYVCTCPPGYTGFNCERINHCLSSPCNNQGTCISTTDNYYCVCNPGFSGNNCSTVFNQPVPVNKKQKGSGIGVIVGGVIGGIFSLFVIITLVILAVVGLIHLLMIKKASRANNFNMEVNAAYVKAIGQDTEYYSYVKITGQDTEYYSNSDDIEMKTNDGYGILSTSTPSYEIIQEI